MKDFTDLIFTIAIVISLITFYHRLSILSHRMDMIIMVQQSQQIYIDKLMEDKQ